LGRAGGTQTPDWQVFGDSHLGAAESVHGEVLVVVPTPFAQVVLPFNTPAVLQLFSLVRVQVPDVGVQVGGAGVQACVLQLVEPEQAAPPQDGAGFVQVLVPPPHVLVHALHTPFTLQVTQLATPAVTVHS